MTPDFEALLEPYSETLSELCVTGPQKQMLAEFLTRVWIHNEEINLFSRQTSPEQLIAQHLLDVLVALPYLPHWHFVADLGSGGGFPAIPLAIVRAQTTFICFEKSPLKRLFLTAQKKFLPNLEVASQVEPERWDLRIDGVIARAFKPVAEILALTRRHYESGRGYLLYKARNATIQAEIAAAKLPAARYEIQPLPTFGETEERNLLLIPGLKYGGQRKSFPIVDA